MSNHKSLSTVVGIAAGLFLTASGVKASTIGDPMDIKPGSCPNSVNIVNPTSKGVIPVAILGTSSFDVNDVDVSSLEIFRADGVGGALQPLHGPPGPRPTVEDIATPFSGPPCDCHDRGADGFDDLLLKFSNSELGEVLELGSLPNGSIVDLCVRGNLLDGTPILVGDCIRIVNPND